MGLQVNLYREDDWPKAQRALTCTDRLKFADLKFKARTEELVSSNQGTTKETFSFSETIPGVDENVYYFVMIADCLLVSVSLGSRG